MQLKRFEVVGLFGDLNHVIPFPVPGDESTEPAVVVLHGLNGVGKTTVLRMLDGMLRLDFDPFRHVPFATCDLEFDTSEHLLVERVTDSQPAHLSVSYRDMVVMLSMEKSGPVDRDDREQVLSVDEFRQTFFAKTEDIAFEFIDTERLRTLQPQGDELEETLLAMERHQVRSLPGRVLRKNPKARAPLRSASLADRVRGFIREAQVNYRTFFSTTEPDLFPRIVERLRSGEAPNYDVSTLRATLERIHQQDLDTERFGLGPDRWDYDQMMSILHDLSRDDGARRTQALTVLGSYVELLGSRAAERALVADRLVTFERLMNSFFSHKRVTIESRQGILIESPAGEALEELQLSSGEYHLLFLMVAALTTKRRGTIIAIDEPEMSMHIGWQRRLLPALLECASNAEPLFIFATHSPDMAAAYPEAMIELH